MARAETYHCRHEQPQYPQQHHHRNFTMRTHFFCPCARDCLFLLVFTILSAPNAQCGSPFRHALGAIKARVGHVLHKIGIDRNQDPSPPRYRKDQRTTEASDPKYGYPPMTDQTSPQSARQQPSFKPSDSNGNASENIAPSVTINPSIILSKPQQRVDADDIQPLRELSTDDTSRKTAGLPSAESSSTRSSNPSIKPSNGSSSKLNTTAGGSQNATARDLPPTPSSGQTLYAKPVVGHPGFVYPPGVVEELKNMLDVRGSAVGQKMRDPRTGNTFLVP